MHAFLTSYIPHVFNGKLCLTSQHLAINDQAPLTESWQGLYYLHVHPELDLQAVVLKDD